MPTNLDVAAVAERVTLGRERILSEVRKVIVGQDAVIDQVLMALVTGGHCLITGVPGLAKTMSVKTLSEAVHVKFQRIQFTPDLLPADLIGTMIYNQKDGKFFTRRGPIFANFILADEINRAPAKVQSALLEAMQERQITEPFKMILSDFALTGLKTSTIGRFD